MDIVTAGVVIARVVKREAAKQNLTIALSTSVVVDKFLEAPTDEGERQ